jgi:hypothetical protein
MVPFVCANAPPVAVRIIAVAISRVFVFIVSPWVSCERRYGGRPADNVHLFRSFLTAAAKANGVAHDSVCLLTLQLKFDFDDRRGRDETHG